MVCPVTYPAPAHRNKQTSAYSSPVPGLPNGSVAASSKTDGYLRGKFVESGWT